jgi:hypothetical protein
MMISSCESGKLLYLNELNGEQRRQLIDTQQVYGAWRDSDAEKHRRFAGSMRWAERNGTDYLLRKVGSRETSLGPRSGEIESTYTAFMDGRKANKEKLESLAKRLDAMAPVSRAMGLGRMPTIAARIVRRCDEKGLLGQQLFIVGTNALYAYEAIGGVQFASGLVASGDIDLLYDARRRLSLALDKDIRESGLIGLLQQVDKSFSMTRPRSFRASNKDGYLVDLIRPQPRNLLRDTAPSALTDLSDDLEGAAIFGLAWLINGPKVEAVVLDERGYPVRLVVIDPRIFALHKAWVAERPDRDPVKAPRDREQALAATLIAKRYMRLPFDSPDMTALPAALRDMAPSLIEKAESTDSSSGETPNW